MLDPSSINLGQVASVFRDFSIVVALVTFAWKARGFYEQVDGFVIRVIKHMDSMESFARTVTDNHLKHIEADLKTLSGRKNDVEITRNSAGE